MGLIREEVSTDKFLLSERLGEARSRVGIKAQGGTTATAAERLFDGPVASDRARHDRDVRRRTSPPDALAEPFELFGRAQSGQTAQLAERHFDFGMGGHPRREIPGAPQVEPLDE